MVFCRLASRGKPRPENDAGSRHAASRSDALTTSVAVAVSPPAAAVIVDWPAATPSTLPDALTVATCGEDDDQVTVPVAIDAPNWSRPAAVAVAGCPT